MSFMAWLPRLELERKRLSVRQHDRYTSLDSLEHI